MDGEGWDSTALYTHWLILSLGYRTSVLMVRWARRGGKKLSPASLFRLKTMNQPNHHRPQLPAENVLPDKLRWTMMISPSITMMTTTLSWKMYPMMMTMKTMISLSSEGKEKANRRPLWGTTTLYEAADWHLNETLGSCWFPWRRYVLLRRLFTLIDYNFVRFREHLV